MQTRLLAGTRRTVPEAVACCRDLRVACKTPFSGLCCKKVAAFCSDDQAAPEVAAWAGHALHHSDCSAYSGVPFLFTPLEAMLAEPAAQAALSKQHAEQQQAAEAQLLKAALVHMEQQAAAAAAGSRRSGLAGSTQLLIGAAAGALCVAIAAALLTMRRGESAEDILAECDDVVGANLDACQPDGACCSGPAPLSRVVSVASLGSANSVREPLLPQSASQGMIRCGSHASDTWRPQQPVLLACARALPVPATHPSRLCGCLCLPAPAPCCRSVSTNSGLAHSVVSGCMPGSTSQASLADAM